MRLWDRLAGVDPGIADHARRWDSELKMRKAKRDLDDLLHRADGRAFTRRERRRFNRLTRIHERERGLWG